MSAMSKGPRIRPTDLRGAARLATEATTALADLVEAMHERIARPPGIAATGVEGRTRGITGLVYKTIRGVTRVVGGSVDSLLSLLAPTLDAHDSPQERDALVAALNGVLGDHLAATANPLATSMALRRNARSLPITDAAALADALPNATGTLLVMIHGLCMNDRQWTPREGLDFGAALGQARGFTPVDLLYNSGLHVSINGRELARHLERLIERWPRRPLERIVLVGHSMGGLLARSAAHHGTQDGHRWRERLSDMVFLGTPHHGAPLERAGNWIDVVLGATPYAAPLARLGKLRSAGITDLRHGNLLDEDWTGHDRFTRQGDPRRHVPLPTDVRCHAVATHLGERLEGSKARIVGDGLVHVDSALGRHADPARCLAFDPSRQWIGEGIGHLELVSHPRVRAQVLEWL
jgi:pimeloyl-ACP methyl ester carboxylesterase